MRRYGFMLTAFMLIAGSCSRDNPPASEDARSADGLTAASTVTPPSNSLSVAAVSEYAPEQTGSGGTATAPTQLFIGLDYEAQGDGVADPEKSAKLSAVFDGLNVTEVGDGEQIVRSFVEIFGEAAARKRGIVFSDAKNNRYQWPRASQRATYPVTIAWNSPPVEPVNATAIPAFSYTKNSDQASAQATWSLYAQFISDEGLQIAPVDGWLQEAGREFPMLGTVGTIAADVHNFSTAAMVLIPFYVEGRNVKEIRLTVVLKEADESSDGIRKQLSNPLGLQLMVP